MAALLKEYLGTSYLFGATHRSSRSCTRAIWRTRRGAAPSGGATSISCSSCPARPTWRTSRSANLSSSWSRRPRAAAARADRQLGGGRAQAGLRCCSSINAYRFLGMRRPTSIRSSASRSRDIPELDPASYGLTEADMDGVFNTGVPGRARSRCRCGRSCARCARPTAARSAPSTCTSPTVAQQRWIQQRLERTRAQPNYSPD